MKLLRHGPKGHEKPGLLDDQGQVRDLSALMPDITAATLSPAALAALRGVDVASLPVVSRARLGVPWAGMSKFIAIGLNYADHAAESNMPIPKEPIVFMKTVDSAVGCNHAVVLPQGSVKSDWEVELGVVIGSRARYVSRGRRAGARGRLLRRQRRLRARIPARARRPVGQGQGLRHLRPDRPLAGDGRRGGRPAEPGMWLEVNGHRYQNGSTKTMIFGVAQLVSYLSRFMTLHPGDLITTGTPPGVGMGVKPAPVYLKPGDVMRLGIEKLGEQQQTVHAWDPALIDG